MKKYLIAALIVALTVGGCGWLNRQVGESPTVPAPKAQICPDDFMACR